jgi:hypothetical protein
MAHQISQNMRNCIENCTDCHKICMETVTHCLQMGGTHADPRHIGLLLDCADICATSANFMLRGSEFHGETCGVCADVCERCANSCEQLANGDETMLRCAEMCRKCAASCREMAA